MRLADIAVRRPVGVLMLALALILLGMVSLSRLAMDLLPDMEIPVAAIVTTYPGAGPQEVEQLVTRPIEESVATVENLTSISSISQANSSMVIAQFDWGTDMNVVNQDVRESVDWVQRALPSDAERSMVFKFDPTMMPVLVMGFSGDQSLADLHRIAEDTIKPRLERLEGVASVAVQGGRQREIQVQLDPVAMQGYGVSAEQVMQSIRAGNLNLAGGTVEEGSREYLVRVPGEFVSLRDVEGVVVPTPEGAPVRLVDIAEIRDGYRDADVISRLNGEPSLALVVMKQPQANTIQVVQAVQEALDRIEQGLPGDVQFEAALDQAEFIELAVGNLRNDLLMGCLLAALVIFIFLRNIRTTVIICTTIPLAIVGACNMIYFSGETLNLLTLGGLALGVGVIVDDAIVVLENVYRHRREGLPPLDAARTGASEVTGAVIGASLTSMAVFLPIVFVGGISAEIFGPLALTVVFALLSSLVMALTVVPMLGSRLLARMPEDPRADGKRLERLLYLSGAWMERLKDWYGRILARSLRRRRLVVILAAAVFLASLALVSLVGTEFFPAVDEGVVSVGIEMPRGTATEETDRMAARVEEIASRIPEVETVSVSVGAGDWMAQSGMGGTASDRAAVDIRLVPLGERSRSSGDVAEEFRRELARIPGATFRVDTSGGFAGMMGGAPVEVRLKGDDLDTLARLGEQAAALVAGVEGTREVQSSLEEGRPEVQVLVDRDRASAHGLSVHQVALAVRTALHGEVATVYRVGGDEIDVRVRLAEDFRRHLADLENLLIAAPTGAQVMLRDVAHLAVGESPVAITRDDQARTVSITAQIAGRDLGSVNADVQSVLSEMSLPSGYYFETGGEAEEMMDAFGELGFALVLAVVLIYIVLAVLFESLFFPFVIMFSLPVSLTGMVLALLLTGRSFSLTAFIGVIVAMGIVGKNCIVLIDYVNQLRRKGMERDEAIRTAGPVRLRPILMTTLTTVCAMLPIALGLGEGAEFTAPMATVIIGGLVFSTVVSLVLVPVIYSVFDDWGRKIIHRFSRGADVSA
ncbi:MAG: efflux RND transporter permease subunit [Candidatus Desulforudis sp.]|nr:efflux RND transporter permease subunit [Desulforudis sp.]